MSKHQDSPLQNSCSGVPTSVGSLSYMAARRLKAAGIPAEPLMKAAGLPAEVRTQHQLRVKTLSQIEFLNRAAKTLGDPFLGFHLALDCDFRSLSPVFYAMASAPTLEEALRTQARYTRLVNEGIGIACQETSGLISSLDFDAVERHLDDHEAEFWAAGTLGIARLITGVRLVPTFVSFAHRRDNCVSEMTAYFGRHIAFGAAHDRLTFSSSDGELPVLSVDPYLSEFLAASLDEILTTGVHQPSSLRTQVINSLSRLIPHGTADLATVARDLGMSTRTLCRRLGDEGETFRNIRAALRAELAAKYLPPKNRSVSEVAHLLGYADVNSFIQAHRRWTGKTPTQWRQDNLG